MAFLEELLAEEGSRRKHQGRRFEHLTSSQSKEDAATSLAKYMCGDIKSGEAKSSRRKSDSNRHDQIRSHNKPCDRFPQQRFKGARQEQELTGSLEQNVELMAETSNRSSVQSIDCALSSRNSFGMSRTTSMESSPLALDEADVKAVISVISAYCNRFLKNKDSRNALRQKCLSRLRVKSCGSSNYAELAVVANLEHGIDAVEAVAAGAEGVLSKEAQTLEKAKRMLGIAASLDGQGSNHGVKNSYLAACAHFYLAMACKLQKNDRLAALHLLQVLWISPSQGRRNFCKETWDYLFLPHLLHLKVWYNDQYESIESDNYASASSSEQSRALKMLGRVYNELLDEGTRQFALYYKEWLIAGVKVRAYPFPKPPSPRLYEIHDLESPAARVDYDFAGWDDSSYTDSDIRSTPIRRSLSEAVFGTPERTGLLDETTLRKLNEGERNKTLPSMHDLREIDVPSSVKGISTKNQFITVLEEPEDMEKGPDNCQLENIAADTEEDSTRMTEDQEKGDEEHLLQPWAHMLKSSTIAEKCCALSKISDRKGNGLTQKKLAEILPCLQQTKTFENYISPLNPLCSTLINQPNSDSERETKLPQSTIQEDECIREKDLISTSGNPISFKSLFSAGILQSAVYSRQSSLVKRPKDFVCPITDQLFEDPVTIETGQTYEHAAIQEWLNCGNTTCPVTQQKLESLALPKTNFVIKRVVDAWKSEHLRILTGHGCSNVRLAQTNSCECRTENQVDSSGPAKQSPSQCSGKPNVNSHMETSTPSCSLTTHFSRITRKSFDSNLSISHSLLSNMKQATATLCTSKSLIECENAALTISRVWLESNSNPIVEAILSKAAIIVELMEVLSISENEEVLQNTVHILAELAVKSEINRKRILKADSDLEIIMRILKSSIFPQGIVLVYLLKLPTSQLVLLDMIPMLVRIPENSSNLEHLNPTQCTPQEAAVSLLEQLLTVFDHTKNIENAKQVIALEGIPFLLRRIGFGNLHEKITAASILSCCMHADGRCRHILVNDIKKASIVELLHYNQGTSRTVAIVFLTELLRLPRRALISKLLREFQNEALLNIMHILLVYLQTELLEQQPMAASLLLQLDLLSQPQRYSVYREEALEAILAALHCETNAKAQVQSAEALLILGGHFSCLGRNTLEAFLLKKAGLKDDFIDSLKEEQGPLEDTVERWNEEKKAAGDWEKKIVSVLLTKGKSLFEALAKSLSSGNPDLAKPCLVTATWLSDALASMPDTGMQIVACSILLPQLVKILQPDSQLEERVLASLSLHSYMKNPECLHLLSNFAQEIIGPLTRLKWITWTAKEVFNIVAKDSLLSPQIKLKC